MKNTKRILGMEDKRYDLYCFDKIIEEKSYVYNPKGKFIGKLIKFGGEYTLYKTPNFEVTFKNYSEWVKFRDKKGYNEEER